MQYKCLGVFDRPAAGHSEPYFVERFTTLDFRGTLHIHPDSIWGLGNVVITQSHDITSVKDNDWEFTGAAIDKPVIVDAFAWVTSCCVLHDCRIGHHSIVSIGSVVSGMNIPPYVIVRGNPAKIVARWWNGRWVYD